VAASVKARHLELRQFRERMRDGPSALALVCPLEDASAGLKQLTPQAGHVGMQMHRPASEEDADRGAKVGAIAGGERP
jgi:hypothetical protein